MKRFFAVWSLLSVLSVAQAAGPGQFICKNTEALAGAYDVEVSAISTQELRGITVFPYNAGENKLLSDELGYPPIQTIDSEKKGVLKIVGVSGKFLGSNEVILKIDLHSPTTWTGGTRLEKEAGSDMKPIKEAYVGTLKINKGLEFDGEVAVICGVSQKDE